eukprot:scaffold3130_cov108-Isochrysis_galbana.AAC.3
MLERNVKLAPSSPNLNPTQSGGGHVAVERGKCATNIAVEFLVWEVAISDELHKAQSNSNDLTVEKNGTISVNQSSPKKRSRIEIPQLNMPVRPKLRRNERQISDEKNAKSQSIHLRFCKIGLRDLVRFVENSTEILRNGL